MKPKAELHVGTSGFTYEHWRGVFYPDDVPQKRWLEYYAERFETVEVNTTYYHMPREGICDSWRKRTPEAFRFVLKLNRFITHRKRLRDCGDLLDSFLAAAGRLGEKLGPMLVQLPPRFSADPKRLEDFLAICPKRRRWAFEFRDASWLCEEIYAVLRGFNAALVVHDLIENHPRVTTADWTYLRYHGPAGRYAGCYPPERLRAEAEQIRRCLSAGLDVYAYFNNDAEACAVRNAADLKRFVERL
ncbi:MAG TPA: DUF72 domain-containing protein [Phycisphaerae bacterium]|nr:DUF72 domain-containing protein [Phycisphaerae bacterium]